MDRWQGRPSEHSRAAEGPSPSWPICFLSAVGPGTGSVQHTKGPAAVWGCWERALPHLSMSQLNWPQGLLELKAHVSSKGWWERRFVSAISRVFAGDSGPHSLGEVTLPHHLGSGPSVCVHPSPSLHPSHTLFFKDRISL